MRTCGHSQALPLQTISNIRTQAVAWGSDDGALSPLARDFIRQALQKDPELRPSMTQLLDHPWIQQILNPEPEVRRV